MLSPHGIPERSQYNAQSDTIGSNSTKKDFVYDDAFSQIYRCDFLARDSI